MDIREKILAHAIAPWRSRPDQPPRLATLSKWLEENFPHLRVELRESFSSTDYHYKHSRFRRPGKGRTGKELRVYDRQSGELIFTHDSSETYRHNSEVCRWIGWTLMKDEVERKRAAYYAGIRDE